MREPTTRSDVIRFRAEEGAREVGVLLVVFAPLDVALADRRIAVGTAVLFS